MVFWLFPLNCVILAVEKNKVPKILRYSKLVFFVCQRYKGEFKNGSYIKLLFLTCFWWNLLSLRAHWLRCCILWTPLSFCNLQMIGFPFRTTDSLFCVENWEHGMLCLGEEYLCPGLLRWMLLQDMAVWFPVLESKRITRCAPAQGGKKKKKKALT